MQEKAVNRFCEEIENIYRLKVPFEAIYTSVFLVRTEHGDVLVDCATTDRDVDEFIIPALIEMDISPAELAAVVLTHKHGDHAGGLTRLLFYAPKLSVINKPTELWDGITAYPLAGHTADCMGLLDTRSGTLISGDGLQGAGVDKYRCSVKFPDKYLETVEKIKNDKRIENILFSHAYEPWYSDVMLGRDAVEKCLSECLKYVK